MDLLSLSFLSLMAAMSPGPDFAIVTRFALTGCRKSAILASIGISMAIMIHLFYCFFGLALFLQNKAFFTALQLIGSCYLAYLGVKLLLPNKIEKPTYKSYQKAFRSGFFTNLLNPKPSLFFLGIFSQLGTFDMSRSLFIKSFFLIVFITFCWFFSLSILVTHKTFLPYFNRFQNSLMKIMGGVLLFLALSRLFF